MIAIRMPLDLISTLHGTESVHTFSHGNTLPITAMPFGMNHWAPQTSSDFRWWFRAGDRKLQGIRCTHQPSPWIADYGTFLLMPTTGPRKLKPDVWASAYRPDETSFRPHCFEAELQRYRTRIAVVPTERGATLKINFPDGEPTARLLLRHGEGRASVHIDASRSLITGFTTVFHHGVPSNFAMYYAIKLTHPFDDFGTFSGSSPTANEGAPHIEHDENAGAYVEWTSPKGPIEARIATSFISLDQAIHNLKRELRPYSFDELAELAQNAWRAQLGQIELDGVDEQQRATFYTCFYRTKLFPRIAHEIDESGNVHHYSPFDGKVHPGPLYTDNGFWDTYRTHFPLLCLLDPNRVGQMMEGYLNAYREGGWLPQWASPGYRDCMIGTHSDAVFADAIVRGISGFDQNLAFEAVKKNATVPSSEAKFGRKGLNDLRKLGFLTTEHYHGTCATLDFAYRRFLHLANSPLKLGKADDAKQFTRILADLSSNVFDQNRRLLPRPQPRRLLADRPSTPSTGAAPGSRAAPGSTRSTSPHDPAGLIALYGGDDQLRRQARRDDERCRPTSTSATTAPEIHEMTEMAAVDFGQYAHSNQPVHHVLMMYAAAGRAPEKMQHWVRRVMNELYGSGPKGLCGDEDNGEMTAWYVLNAIGLFPLCPGNRSEWVLTSPIAAQATIKRRLMRKAFDDRQRRTASVKRSRVRARPSLLNGNRPHEKLVIEHAALTRARRVTGVRDERSSQHRKRTWSSECSRPMFGFQVRMTDV